MAMKNKLNSTRYNAITLLCCTVSKARQGGCLFILFNFFLIDNGSVFATSNSIYGKSVLMCCILNYYNNVCDAPKRKLYFSAQLSLLAQFAPCTSQFHLINGKEKLRNLLKEKKASLLRLFGKTSSAQRRCVKDFNRNLCPEAPQFF